MIAVIACGNLNRCDDGVGAVVLQRLQACDDLAQRKDLRLYSAATDGLAVMFQARGCEELIILDASRGEQTPGAIFEVDGGEFESQREPPRDSHALRWDDALTIGRKLYADDFPQRIRVFLIEAQDLSLGLELSAPVAQAADTLAARLRAELSSQTTPA